MDIERNLGIGLQLSRIEAVVHGDGAAVEGTGAAIAVIIETGGVSLTWKKRVLREIGNGATTARPDLADEHGKRIADPEPELGRWHFAFSNGVHRHGKLFETQEPGNFRFLRAQDTGQAGSQVKQSE